MRNCCKILPKARRAAAPVSKNALIEAAWPGLAIEDSNLTIAALRRVIDQDNGASWIETLPRRGYRYVGPPVTRVEERAADPAPSAPEKAVDRRAAVREHS
jgi:DNA-binding winged helix-turn-helix (wHTH) protein